MIALSTKLITVIRRSAVISAPIDKNYSESAELAALGLVQDVDWNGESCYELTAKGRELAAEIRVTEWLFMRDWNGFQW